MKAVQLVTRTWFNEQSKKKNAMNAEQIIMDIKKDVIRNALKVLIKSKLVNHVLKYALMIIHIIILIQKNALMLVLLTFMYIINIVISTNVQLEHLHLDILAMILALLPIFIILIPASLLVPFVQFNMKVIAIPPVLKVNF